MKAKNILEWIISFIGIATLALSLAGQTKAAIILAGVSLLLSLVMFMVRVVSAIRAGSWIRVLLRVLLLAALLFLIAGVAGMTYVSSLGITEQSFDDMAPHMKVFADAMSAEVPALQAILAKALLLASRTRRLCLRTGGALMLLVLVLRLILFAVERKKQKATSFEQTAPEVQPFQPLPLQPVQTPFPAAFTPEEPAPQPVIQICDDRCCICGADLTEGFAVLCTDPNGREARIDRDCWSRIDTLCSGTDAEEITEAGAFLYGQIPLVEPAVAEQLRNYVWEADRRLSENS